MERYRVLLSSQLEKDYKAIADRFNMAMEQVLSGAVQIYAEWLNQKTYEGICDLSNLPKICPSISQKGNAST